MVAKVVTVVLESKEQASIVCVKCRSVNSFITNLEEVIGVSSVHVLAEPLDII